MNSSIEKKAFQFLMESGRIGRESLEAIYQRSETSEYSFSKLLVREGVISEEDLLRFYGEKFNMPFLRLKTLPLEKSVIDKIPVKFAWYYRFFPISLKDRKLSVAVSRLVDLRILDEMRFGLGFEIELNFAPESDIEEMLKNFYGVGSDTVERMIAQSSSLTAALPAAGEPPVPDEVQDLEKLAETASVVQLVNQIILEAYRKRASDIHLEPLHGKIRLRYRIDGILKEAPVPAEINQFFTAILSRVKIMANLNIVERRLPQDGKARVKVQNEMIDLRISSIPTPYGESMVIRILPNRQFLSLEHLGFEPENLGHFKELLKQPYGIVFVTGPTGSGKSTTLNAALNVMNLPERKIITIEDPVEYDMEGITQIQVQPEIGLSFARGLRSVLRHDPDIMMVGEVRDFETADTAIRVALTGHLIFSTLHTNDAASGITRLLDIGVEPYLIASSVLAFMAQRLVRTICPHCKEEDPNVLPEILKMIRRDLGYDETKRVKFYRGKGCDQCGGTGFQGRMAIHELLLLEESLHPLILKRVSSDEIKHHARNRGMVTLRQDGWKKVLKGLTVPEEIIRVTPADQSGQHAFAIPASAEEAPLELPQEPALPKVRIEKGESYEDKRKYGRVKVNFHIAFRVIDMHETELQPQKEGLFFEAVTQDLSAGGVSFLTDQKLNSGDILEFRIELPDSKIPIQCIGRTLRIVRSEGKELLKAAVSFLAINSQDRQRLENYCGGLERHEKI